MTGTRNGRALARGAAIVAACGFAGLATACGAFEQALSDPGDEALAADASARVEAEVVEPASYRTRPVTLLVDAAGRGSNARTSTDAGVCGWSGDESWRAGLGNGGLTATADDDGLHWTVLDVAGTSASGALDVEGGRVLDAVLTAWVDRDRQQPYEPVEREGRLEVESSGLSARFVADDVPAVPDGVETVPFPELVVQVTCGAGPEQTEGAAGDG